MDQLMSLCLLLVLFAGVYDFLTRKIPNWLTLGGIVVGVTANFYLHGGSGLLLAVGGVAAGFAFYFPLYIFQVMGAGDAKLLMLIGAFGGATLSLRVGVLAIFIGAVYAAVYLAFVGRLFPLLRDLGKFLSSILSSPMPVPAPEINSTHKFSYGLCLAASTAVIVALRLSHAQMGGLWLFNF